MGGHVMARRRGRRVVRVEVDVPEYVKETVRGAQYVLIAGIFGTCLLFLGTLFFFMFKALMK